MKNTFVHPLILVLAAITCWGTVSRGESKVDYTMLDRQLHSIITNKHTSDTDLLKAISRLGRVTETPDFWNQIANNADYSLKHRERAVFALFRRHCTDKRTFKDLSAVLKQQSWLRQSSIIKVDVITGRVPILPGNQALYKIVVLSQTRTGIYLRVSPEVDSAFLFSQLIHGDERERNPEIFEYGYDDDYEKWLLNTDTH